MNRLQEYKEIIKEFITVHKENPVQIMEMAKTDLIKTYRSAAMGWSWAVVKPGTRLFIYWFAIAIGLRGSTMNGEISYFSFLITGLVPWFYMSDLINDGPKIVRKYGYLVTKLRYPVLTIPTFFSISHLIVHIALMLITGLVLILQGQTPDIYWLQILFYMLVMVIFFNAWGLLAGMLGAMSLDFVNLVSSFSLALFWLSGILFDPDAMEARHPNIAAILAWNPVTIIVKGYRESFLYKIWFWEKPDEMRNLLIMFIILVCFAFWSYRRLRKDIADVL